MNDESNFTAKKLLDGLFEQIRPHANDPKKFASEWERITRDLDEKIKKPKSVMDERDRLAREPILLVRTQLANSYLFDDLWLQHSQNCSVLSDYAELDRPAKDGWRGHSCDGITWVSYEKHMMPGFPEKRLDFGKKNGGWPYCSCMDHVIANLVYIVWGLSDVGSTKPRCDEKFEIGWWKDSSMYLAVLLCFGDNSLKGQTLLDAIGVKIDENSQDNLQDVLSAEDPRPKLLKRIQKLIQGDNTGSPQQA